MSKRRVDGRTMAGLGHPAISAMYRTQDLRERMIEDASRDWGKEEDDWQEKCAEVEGVLSFRAWYDDNNNVPAFGKASERVMLLKDHYQALKVSHADAFYWLEVETKEVESCMEIEGRASFCDWWDGADFPANTTPKQRVELIRARIATFLTNAGTTQVQARVRYLQNALATGQAQNIIEVTNELAELVNHIQRVGAPMENGE